MTTSYTSLAKQPIALLPNRVWRTYRGGAMIDTWQGNEQPMDSSAPEEWVASVVKASNVGREHIQDEGLSRVKLANGTEAALKDVIASDPQAFLGAAHVARYGTHTAVLVKVLDAGERLTIQVHPDPIFAQNMFHSEFGKTEAWYMLGGREINGEPPYVLFGFKPGVTAASWKKLFDRQDIPGMINALHRIPVQPGEVYLIEGGMPHAIGSGCFLVEIQEPTDYTLRVERTTPNGTVLSDQACHQGLGFDQMLECFHYDTYSIDEVRNRYLLPPRIIQEADGGTLTTLIDANDTDRFRMNRLTVQSSFEYMQEETFAVAIILEGNGQLAWELGAIEVAQGDTFFLPASLSTMQWNAQESNPLSVMLCLPPKT